MRARPTREPRRLTERGIGVPEDPGFAELTEEACFGRLDPERAGGRSLADDRDPGRFEQTDHQAGFDFVRRRFGPRHRFAQPGAAARAAVGTGGSSPPS